MKSQTPFSIGQARLQASEPVKMNDHNATEQEQIEFLFFLASAAFNEFMDLRDGLESGVLKPTSPL